MVRTTCIVPVIRLSSWPVAKLQSRTNRSWPNSRLTPQDMVQMLRQVFRTCIDRVPRMKGRKSDWLVYNLNLFQIVVGQGFTHGGASA